MSNSNLIYFFKEQYRLNFIGKPFELNKLVYEETTLLGNKDEAEKVIKAYKKFKGLQNLGMLINFGSLYLAMRFYKNGPEKNSRKFSLMAIALLPYLFLYVNSHYSYWNIIREVVISSRERDKKYKKLNSNTKEEFVMLKNKSNDLKKYIQQNIGFFSCLKGVFSL